jgi:hypothetical protein
MGTQVIASPFLVVGWNSGCLRYLLRQTEATGDSSTMTGIAKY